ncbi:MAG: hypothetical protein OXP66_13655 [Candidatus Tectomicrobia bacterium]|nr:hypothetical protein [Candidatus Tectomicrobia bacterium]
MATYKDATRRVPADEMSVSRMPGRMGRVMNSQMNISLPIEMHERLREIAWEHRQPLSHVCRELLEMALRVHETYGKGEPPPASE